MSVKMRIDGLSEALNSIRESFIQSFNESVPEALKTHLESQIDSQVDALGNPFPKKASQTIKLYAEGGFNTTKYLIKTGESVKLQSTKFGNKLVIQPVGWEKLRYHVGDGKIAWPTLNEEAIKVVYGVISKDLNKTIKRFQ